MGIILKFLRLVVSTFVFVFLQNAIHKQTFLIDLLFSTDFLNNRGGMVSWFSSFRCFYAKKMPIYE
jgi:hypothetical protein